MTLEYSKKVMKEFLQPKNYGKIKNADAVGEVGNAACGDIMQMQIKVNKKTKKIENIKFQTFGCASAIATTSIITQLVKGKTLEQAKQLTMQDVIKKLKGLPQIKVHCSTMGIHALRKTIKNYEEKNEKSFKETNK